MPDPTYAKCAKCGNRTLGGKPFCSYCGWSERAGAFLTEHERRLIDVETGLERARPTHARATDVETAHEHLDRTAADGTQKRIDVLILAELARGDRTEREVSESLERLDEIPRTSVSPRFAPLARAGLIHRTGERRDGGRIWRLGSGPGAPPRRRKRTDTERLEWLLELIRNGNVMRSRNVSRQTIDAWMNAEQG